MLCNYIITSFMELDDNLFNYSDYTVDGNGEVEWFKPDYAKFENTLGITVPKDYKERPLPSTMENRKNNIKVYFYIESFSLTLWTVNCWLSNSDQGRSSGTSHTIDNWIKTCSNLLQSHRLENNWPVPAYWTNFTRVTPIFLTFIELILDLPYAIPAASAYWYNMLKDWKSLSMHPDATILSKSISMKELTGLQSMNKRVQLWPRMFGLGKEACGSK